MDDTNACGNPPPARPLRQKLSRDTVFLIGDLLPLFDFAGVLLAAYLGTLLYAGMVAASQGILDDVGRAALAAAALAPFLLCDRAFVSYASAGETAALIRCYVVRFLLFAGVVAALGVASRFLADLPRGWLALWFLATLAVTALTRLLLVIALRRLEHAGVLTESIAVVGAGPVADRLIRHLRQTRRDHVEILGVFEDRATRHEGCEQRPTGSVADLIELGKARTVDWIVLTLPPTAENRLQRIVHRLKALAFPVGLCPQDVGLDASAMQADGLGRAGTSRWDVARAAVESVVPQWIVTLLALPLAALGRARAASPPLTLSLDDYDLERFAAVAAGFGQARFAYAVTPNADHLIRLHRTPAFRALYADADFVLLDSRFISRLLRTTRKLRLPVCAGSDLTAMLFDRVIGRDDRLVLIGASASQAADLRERYGLTQLAHFNPPMGFIQDPRAVETCLRFVEAHSPFRFCLLAVGAPQQETIAHELKSRGIARGLALCIGASIDFLTGTERRAPRWMQRYGMEWLFRLLQAPRRMAGRYLLRGPRLFHLLTRTQFVLRPATGSDAAPAPAPVAAPLAPEPLPEPPPGPAPAATRPRAMPSGPARARRPTPRAQPDSSRSVPV